jgi:hypothetical protein
LSRRCGQHCRNDEGSQMREARRYGWNPGLNYLFVCLIVAVCLFVCSLFV